MVDPLVSVSNYYIFSSRVAVLARPQGGTIHNLRTEYSPVLSDPKGMQYLLYDSNLVGEKIERGGEKEKEKERRRRGKKQEP